MRHVTRIKVSWHIDEDVGPNSAAREGRSV